MFEKCPVCNTPMITGECMICKSTAHEKELEGRGFTQKIICPDCRIEKDGERFLDEKLPRYVLCDACATNRVKAKDKYIFADKVPPRYAMVKVEDGPPWDTGVFWGNFGTGKTWSAYAVAKRVGGMFEIKTELGLINYLKAGFSEGDFEKRENYLKNLDFLAVDEFGKIPETEFNRAQMFEILNYRYDYELPTILILNCDTVEELKNLIPNDIQDRFKINNRHFKGDSRR